MIRRRLSIAIPTAAVFMLFTADASALCAQIKPTDAKQQAAKVFEGTVTAIRAASFEGEFAATIEVLRVWKGDVPNVATVHFVRDEDDNFKIGAMRIFFVQPLTPTLRALERLPETSPHREMWVPACRAWWDLGIDKNLGQPRPQINLATNAGTDSPVTLARQKIPDQAQWEITFAQVEAAARLTELRISRPGVSEARLMQRPWSASSPLPFLRLVRLGGKVQAHMFVFWASARLPRDHQPQGDGIACREGVCVKPIDIAEQRDWEQDLAALTTSDACPASPSVGGIADGELVWVKTAVNGQYQEQSCPQPRPDSLAGTLLQLMKESARSARYGFK